MQAPEQPDKSIVDLLVGLLADALKEVRRVELVNKEQAVQNAVLKHRIEALEKNQDLLRVMLKPLIDQADSRSHHYRLRKLWQNSLIKIVTIVAGSAAGIATLIGALAGLLKIVLPHLQAWLHNTPLTP